MNRSTQPAIVTVAYNRPHSLARLLGSLERASYADEKDIPLVISIDGSDDTVYAVASAFEWPHGEKKIIRRAQHLGLRMHVVSCGDLSDVYGSVLILEDDMYVGRGFYGFARQALEKYRDDSNVAGISLYSYSYNEFAKAPFMPVADGFDAYFMQVPSSWGQVWTRGQWEKFRAYYDGHSGELSADHRIPHAVSEWPTSTSWKKYLYRYMVENDLYFVFPKVSHATNFGEVGTHYRNQTQVLQVPIAYNGGAVEYKLPSFQESSQKYDAFLEPRPELFEAMGVELPFEYEVDLYGLKNLDGCTRPYVLSVKPCREPQRSFGIRLMPLILNIAGNVQGTDLALAPREAFVNTAETYSPLISKQLQPSGYGAGHSAGYSAGYIDGRQSVLRWGSSKLSRWIIQPARLIRSRFRPEGRWRDTVQ